MSSANVDLSKEELLTSGAGTSSSSSSIPSAFNSSTAAEAGGVGEVTPEHSEEESILELAEKRKPTNVKDEFWIVARNPACKDRSGENCGKWLIFEPYSRIDKIWELIREETEKGKLGRAAKVSTMKDKDERNREHGDSNFVICVYTYDHEDEEDAMRVRERLREIGFQKKLPYKTDSATYAGLYRSTTGSRVSKWYC